MFEYTWINFHGELIRNAAFLVHSYPFQAHNRLLSIFDMRKIPVAALTNRKEVVNQCSERFDMRQLKWVMVFLALIKRKRW